MLTIPDEQRIREIVKEETADMRKTVNHTANNVDKILKIAIDLKDEYKVTRATVDIHEKRLSHVEKKLKQSSPARSFTWSHLICYNLYIPQTPDWLTPD